MHKTYTVIMLDPAWSFANKHIGGNGKSGAVDKYPTMTVEEIAALPISRLADPKECVLAMWITKDHFLEGAQVPILQAWGFTPRQAIIWAKKGKRYGLGHWFQNKWEALIIATKGHVKAFHSKMENIVFDTEVVEAEPIGHSIKPPIFRNMLEMCTRGLSEQRFLEINARVQVDGWDAIGLDMTGKDMRTVADLSELIVPAPE